MRIAVLNLTAGGLSGGYRKYLREVVPRLAAAPGVEGVSVLLPAAAGPIDGMGAVSVHAWPVGHPWATRSWIRERLRELRPDVVFVPTARLTRLPYSTVVMVRNMEPLVPSSGGNSMMDALRNIARRAAARRACRAATRVIAVSRYVQRFVLDEWKIPETRVAVIPHGVTPPAAGASYARPASVREKPQLFTAGSIRPARGLEDLWVALTRLAGRGKGATLAVAGSADPGSRRYAAALKARAVDLGIETRIEWTGQLDAAEMAWCYRNCTAFVMTSRVEACPNVALEAMSHGAVCVASDNPPLPEFFADAALYYPAGDGLALAGVLESLESMPPEEMEELRGRARRRAAAFSWENTAERTLEVLRAAAGRSA